MEKGLSFKLIPFGNKSLLNLTGKSGKRLKEFILNWNRFNQMATFFKLTIEESD